MASVFSESRNEGLQVPDEIWFIVVGDWEIAVGGYEFVLDVNDNQSTASFYASFFHDDFLNRSKVDLSRSRQSGMFISV
jgi:hypothetical protein